MRIGIASLWKNLNSPIDCHTGRANCFIVYDTENESYETIENVFCLKQAHWAGAKSATTLSNEKIDAIIVAHIGPNAHRIFTDNQIEIYHCADISVAAAIKLFRENQLVQLNAPNCAGHNHSFA